MKVNQFDPCLSEEEIEFVVRTLKDNWITEGKMTEELQRFLQDYCGVKHAILLPNGTLSLYVALMILGVGRGDEVIVPNFTFIGSATAVVLTGAKPVFSEIDKEDFQIDIASLKACISKRTKAIMPVHIYGQAAKMDSIQRIAKEHSLYIVEDAAQGMGVTFGAQHVGTIGDVGCISFYADKTITMGEGGAILTNDSELANRCRYFKNQGRLERGSFIHPEIGFNFRITDLQAAVGLAQIRKINYVIQRKLEIENLYKKLLTGVQEVQFPKNSQLGKRVPFRINLLVSDPEALQENLNRKEIATRRFFYPLHRQPCFSDNNCVRFSDYPNSNYAFDKGISMPSGVNLTEEQIKYTCGSIKEFYS